MSKFKNLAQQICNGCDLVTSDENKLTTEELAAAGKLTLKDFALCKIEDDLVGVVTFEEFPDKYHWGGQSITNMVKGFVESCGSEAEARAQYQDETEKVVLVGEITKTKAKNDFFKITVL